MPSPSQAFAHVPDALTQLLSRAIPHGGLPYAGNLTPSEAYSFLQENPGVLVDVRTLPEWQFTGTPDVSLTQGHLATISWKTYPQFILNPQFEVQLAAEEGVRPDTLLFFMCRSGGRSLDAAIAMSASGYRYCFNITGGFEGEPDGEGHRGRAQGWKAATLPWKQG